MYPNHEHVRLSWPGLALVVFALCRPVAASYWTVTSCFILSATTDIFSGLYTTDILEYTSTLTVKKGATPTKSAVSTSLLSYGDLTIVSVFLPPGAVPDKDVITTRTYITDGDTVTDFMQPVVYTAPKSCPTALTYTTEKDVDIPREAWDQVTPTKVTTSTGTNADYTAVTAYLTPNAVTTVTAATTDNVYLDYIGHCLDPNKDDPYYETPSGGGGGGGGGYYTTSTVVVIVSPRAIAGICIGAIVFLAAVGSLLYRCFCFKRRKQQAEPVNVTFLPPTSVPPPQEKVADESGKPPPSIVREVA